MFAFIATAGGRELAEPVSTWDDVPHGVSRLLLVADGNPVVEIAGCPGRRVFALNEAVASKGGPGILSAKLIGLEEAGTVTEWRLDLLTDDGTPQLTRRSYPLEAFESMGALRLSAEGK